MHYQLLSKYQNVITWGPNDLGTVTTVKHNIYTSQAEPCKMPYLKNRANKTENCANRNKAMLENKIIEESQSLWSAPVVLVHKKDGGEEFVLILEH